MLMSQRIGSLIRVAGASRQKHTLPELPYEYNALEPVISREIMSLHHSKHHATYINNLNVAEEKLAQAQAKADTNTILNLLSAIKFNGGGHINHSIFWLNLTPCKTVPSCPFSQAVEKDFGSWDNLKNQLSTASVAVQGSGWGWLGYNKQMKKLQIATCQNQDPLQATTGLVPLFGIDVWEHAYYLQYKNVRADYVKAIFDVANWNDISQRYEKALK
ncbi:mn superoxide dismutase isoform X2 [Bombyx mori]|uniref:Superoxide dismutase n=1 Tax=Bombyx mori TaxID=7091 RepID=A0A8R2M496_BOMMO|nr:mn superoxide dismutase isoform X2 [Bombyx mori]